LERRSQTRAVVTGPAATRAAAAVLMLALAGCDYASDQSTAGPSGTYNPGLGDRPAQAPPPLPADGSTNPTAHQAVAVAAAEATAPAVAGSMTSARALEKVAILDNILTLIQTAALNPGGSNYGNATKNLNQYFAGTPTPDYALSPAAREYLRSQQPLNKPLIDELESTTWTLFDGRHMEDCMLYRSIAQRVAGASTDDLTRVRRLFDWMVRQVQLAPAALFIDPQAGPVAARPYDVLERGMAVETDGAWAERGWLFLSLCRQLDLDAGLVTYTPPGGKIPIVWCEAVLIDKKPYLFDARIGLPIPDAKGDGVATLDEAMTDPLVLDRMDLPGQLPYGTNRAALNGSVSKVGILLDSSNRYFAPRMKLLQQSLAGKNLTILYRDPAEQRDRWLEALGPHAGKVELWDLPTRVEWLLFNNAQFNQATQRALFLFQPKYPLLYARMKQLRGEYTEAVQDYVTFRFADNPLTVNRKEAIPPDIQKALDAYATYFLGMCSLDQNDPDKATRFFERTLQMLPEPGRGQPYYHMYRWGAQANLGRLMEAKGDLAAAIAYYSQPEPTTQRHGNLLRARDLLWRNPLAPATAPLPPAPPAPPPMLEPAPRFARPPVPRPAPAK
jgi:hypothetical protein